MISSLRSGDIHLQWVIYSLRSHDIRPEVGLWYTLTRDWKKIVGAAVRFA